MHFLLLEAVVLTSFLRRIRLYAGGDRPFFEDASSSKPSLYLIHNLLTPEECDLLIKQASPFLDSSSSTESEDNVLEYLYDSKKTYVNSPQHYLWQGIWRGASQKAIDEKIEQSTGLPANHLTDVVVNRLDADSHWNAHFDKIDGHGSLPMATFFIFLSNVTRDSVSPFSGSVVYPAVKSGPIQIQPKRGMAVVHHSWDDQHKFEATSLHALLNYTGIEPMYVARIYVMASPISIARRAVLPPIAFLYGGKLPRFLVNKYTQLITELGIEAGNRVFDYLCLAIPSFLLLLAAQLAYKWSLKHFTPPPISSRLLEAKVAIKKVQ